MSNLELENNQDYKHKYCKGILLFHYLLIYWYADSIYKKNLPRNAHYSKTKFHFLFLAFLKFWILIIMIKIDRLTLGAKPYETHAINILALF
jgi:hypothetical protein